MGVHVVGALAKLKPLFTTHQVLTPLSASLLWSFVLRLGLSLKLVRGAHAELLQSSRLFAFQLFQIVFDRTGPADQAGDGGSRRRRWERTVRLVYERVSHVRSLTNSSNQSHEESLQAVSMLSL